MEFHCWRLVAQGMFITQDAGTWPFWRLVVGVEGPFAFDNQHPLDATPAAQVVSSLPTITLQLVILTPQF